MSLSAINKPITPLRDRLIPWYFVMAFLVVLAVNAVFVYVAITSNSGVVTEHAYEKGLDYNDIKAEADKQLALGWNGVIDYADGVLQFTLKDKNQTPLTDAHAIAYIERPLEPALNRKIVLEEKAPGDYAATVPFPKKGQWHIAVSVLWQQQTYQISKKLIIP